MATRTLTVMYRSCTLAVAALLAAPLLTACGGDETPAAAAGKDPLGIAAGVPDCADVWVVGETLPEDYEGCMENPDLMAAPTLRDCKDGSEFTSLNDKWYAVKGGEIAAVKGEMAADKAYGAAFNNCVG